MSQTRERSGATYDDQAGVGAGWIVFASVMMIIGGIFAFFEGLGVLLRHGRFYHTVANNPYGTTATGWGWIVLIVGIIVFLAGFAVWTGAMWARIVGIAVASLSAVANFFFIPYYPIWALTIMVLDIFVIWALAAHGKALAE